MAYKNNPKDQRKSLKGAERYVDVNEPLYEPWMNWVKPILDQYAPKDIYNWDETALFWRSSSDVSFVTANEEIVKNRKKD